MTKFTIDVTDKALLAGITSAREDFNASLPIIKNEDGENTPREEHSDYLATDDDYWQSRVLGMLQSWAKQHGYDVIELNKKKAEVADIEAAMAAKGI